MPIHAGLKPSKSAHLSTKVITTNKNNLIINQLKGDDDPWGEDYFPDEDKTQQRRFPQPIRTEKVNPNQRIVDPQDDLICDEHETDDTGKF